MSSGRTFLAVAVAFAGFCASATAAACVDQSTSCAQWKSQQWCNPQVSYNKKNVRSYWCPKTCGVCTASSSPTLAKTPPPAVTINALRLYDKVWPYAVEPGAKIVVKFNIVAPSNYDWVGIYPAGACNAKAGCTTGGISGALAYKYTCTNSQARCSPAAAVPQLGGIDFGPDGGARAWPLPAGAYDLVMATTRNGKLYIVAGPYSFIVAPASPPEAVFTTVANADYEGNDICIDGKCQYDLDAASCQVRCLSTPGCAMCQSGATTAGESTCWLKSAVATHPKLSTGIQAFIPNAKPQENMAA